MAGARASQWASCFARSSKSRSYRAHFDFGWGRRRIAVLRKSEMTGHTGEAADKWFIRFKPVPGARLRLYCLNHAGAGVNAFFPWSAALAPDVEVWGVQLPGRERRWEEPFFTDMEDLIGALADAFGRPPVPYAVFGHSIGSQIAFELVRALRRRGQPEPRHLGLAARVAPHLPLPHAPPVMTCSAEELLAFIDQRYGGFPKEIREVPELMQMFLPQLRADLAVLFSYTFREEPPLSCPITAYSGVEDPGVPAEGVGQWGRHTQGPFAHRMAPGDHFFPHSARATFLEIFRKDLQEAMARTAGQPS